MLWRWSYNSTVISQAGERKDFIKVFLLIRCFFKRMSVTGLKLTMLDGFTGI